jgi:hypothetical protein
MHVTNGILLGCPPPLNVATVNSVQTLKVWRPRTVCCTNHELCHGADDSTQLRPNAEGVTEVVEQQREAAAAAAAASGGSIPTGAPGNAPFEPLLGPLCGARFRQKFTLEDAIEFHAFAPLEASRRVTNAIPLGCPLFLPVHTVNWVQTLKA